MLKIYRYCYHNPSRGCFADKQLKGRDRRIYVLRWARWFIKIENHKKNINPSAGIGRQGDLKIR